MSFSAVKIEFRSFQFYQRLQRVLFYTKVFDCSCHAYLTYFCMTPRNVKLTTMADCEFNYRLCQLASQFSSNRVDDEQRCHFLFKTYYLLNKQHVLLSVVLRNDAEINVIDHARVVKTFRDPLLSLSDY